MNSDPYFEGQNFQTQVCVAKNLPFGIKRRQTQYFKQHSNPNISSKDMPPKQWATPKTPEQTAAKESPPSTDIGIFLRKLGKPMSDIRKILGECQNYEEHFLDHEKALARQKETMKALEAKEEQVKQLEAAVAVFEGVHMNSSKALKEENLRLCDRITQAEERLVEAEERSKASRNVFVKEFEKLIKEKNGELEQTLRDHAASIEKQKKGFEKQHLEIIEQNRSQLSKVIGEMQERGTELEKLDLMNDGLKKKLGQSNRKLKEIQQDFVNIPDDIFKKKCKDLAKDFHSFCKARFMSLPQGATVEQTAFQQQNIKEKLLRVGFTDRIPFFIPTGNIEASKLLRLAGVEHIISESLCRNIFRPIVLHNCSNAAGIFETISDQLHKENPWKEAMWRTLTSNALAEHINADLKIKEMVTKIFDLTSPLIQKDDRETVKMELAELLKRAFETWRLAQKNCTRIFATTKVLDGSSEAWESHPEQDEFRGASEDELEQIDPHETVLCLFPRVYRERLFTADTGVDPEDTGYVYFPGAALYADAGAYIVGQREHRDFQKLMEELSKKAQVISGDPARVSSRRSRRPSLSKAPLLSVPQPHPQTFSERVKKSQTSGSNTADQLEVTPRYTKSPPSTTTDATLK